MAQARIGRKLATNGGRGHVRDMLPLCHASHDPHLVAPDGPGLHDDLLGGSWPTFDDDDEAGRTIAEIDALLGELIAELEA